MTDPQSHVADAAPSPASSGPKSYKAVFISDPAPIAPSNQPPPKPKDLFGGITRRPPRKPAGPPTRERKLKAVSQQQLDAARALVKPQPPIKPGP